MMRYILHIIFGAVVAWIVVRAVIPILVYISYKKHITDNPNIRKLQKRPVPVMGGMGIFIGVLISLLFTVALWRATIDEVQVLQLFVPLAASYLMLYVGWFDDIVGLTPLTKVFFQVITILLLWWIGNLHIDNFHGLLGIYQLSWYISLILSLVAGVGIINAMNLIDGVNGLSSSMGIVSFTCCGFFCLYHHDATFALFAFIFVGALIPFFVFNVFSKKYRIFIGDSGSMVLGVAAYVLISRIVYFTGNTNSFSRSIDPYVVSFVLAVFSMPVFDCIRVMCSRIIRGVSPFKADRTHLHHYLIEAGFSHIMVTFIIVCLNCVVILVWLVTALLQMNILLQFLIVVFASLLCCNFTYYYVKRSFEQHPERTEHRVKRIKEISHRYSHHYLKIQKFVDHDSSMKIWGKIKKYSGSDSESD